MGNNMKATARPFETNNPLDFSAMPQRQPRTEFPLLGMMVSQFIGTLLALLVAGLLGFLALRWYIKESIREGVSAASQAVDKATEGIKASWEKERKELSERMNKAK